MARGRRYPKSSPAGLKEDILRELQKAGKVTDKELRARRNRRYPYDSPAGINDDILYIIRKIRKGRR